MPLSLSISLILSFLAANVATQSDKSWNYGCESLICDPPKICIVQDQVAQCLADASNTTPNLFGGPVFTQPPPAQEIVTSNVNTQFFKQPPEPSQTLPPGFFTTRINIPIGPDPGPTTTTASSPFAPLLSLFGSPPPLQLPTLPTLPPPPTTTTSTPVNICTLPPVTGNCSKARIMWYFDTETGKCERFSYSGCGNNNRFSSRLHCEETCGRK